ncbi:unnamed protein product [Leptosia nina]|uniref:Fe2OG dioxygenase domain-containing protein n=1 Tax=Leptosia nina TaxID=320188 RepID=A0AAV1J3U3_9NEOP
MDREDLFMKKFKYYKRNNPKPSLEQVILFNDEYTILKQVNNIPHTKNDPRTEILGLKDLRVWQSLAFSDHPGFVIIRNPFTALGQRYWIRKCLEEYSKSPNKRNIDIDTSLNDWWSECYKSGKCDKKFQNKLRWTTLGYHHNWDTKVYSEESKGIFPSELAELCEVVAQYLGYEPFRAEAAIVNYYHMCSTLSAHTDHSEVNLDAPLFSFSFGQSAIFLLGRHEKTIEPSAFLLNSGDIAIMSKEARLCYHAVPKILPATKCPWSDIVRPVQKSNIHLKCMKAEDISEMNKNIKENEWRNFENYIAESRININVRQVLMENQITL